MKMLPVYHARCHYRPHRTHMKRRECMIGWHGKFRVASTDDSARQSCTIVETRPTSANQSLPSFSRQGINYLPGVAEPAPPVRASTQGAVSGSPPIVAIAREVALVADAMTTAGNLSRAPGCGSHLISAVPARSRAIVPFGRQVGRVRR